MATSARFSESGHATAEVIANLAQPVAGRIATYLERAILEGRFKPGDWFREVDLAKEFGVSRTPIREAFHILETKGFLSIVPRRGVYVKEVSHDEMASLLEVRSALDGLAAQLASAHIDAAGVKRLEAVMEAQRKAMLRKDIHTFEVRGQDLHAVIYQIAGNPKLRAIYEAVKVEGTLYRIVGFASSGEMQSTVDDHQRIVDALVSGDGEAARRAAERHIVRAQERLRDARLQRGEQAAMMPQKRRARV